MYSIKNTEDLENLNKLVSLQNQVNEVLLQKRLGEQNYHENNRKIYEAITDTIKITSGNSTEIITENSIKNNKALENMNEKLLEWMIDEGMIAP